MEGFGHFEAPRRRLRGEFFLSRRMDAYFRPFQGHGSKQSGRYVDGLQRLSGQGRDTARLIGMFGATRSSPPRGPSLELIGAQLLGRCLPQ
jgi:hypothetical protein